MCPPRGARDNSMATLFLRHLSAAGAEKLGEGARAVRAPGQWRRAAPRRAGPQDFRPTHCLSAVIARPLTRMTRQGNRFFAFLESVEIFHARDES